MINLVIAYSQQKNNKCVMGDSEQDHMRIIAEHLYNILKVDNRFYLYLVPKLNEGSDLNNLRKSIALSNEFINKNGGQGYHLELHSDAGYSATGVSGLYKTTSGKAFLEPIVQELTNLTPWKDVGMRQRTDLGALNQTKAIAGLIEISFHDKPNEAKWIHDKSKEIAQAIANGLYKTFNIKSIVKEILDMFNDFNKVADYAKPSVERIEKLGLIKGDEKNNYRPLDNISRQDFAVVIDRLLKLLGK